MQLIGGLLLALASFGLLPATLAGVSQIPLDLMETLKIAEDRPAAPLLLEDEIFERSTYGDRVGDEAYNEILPESEVESPPEIVSNMECAINIRSGLKNPHPVFLEADADKFYPFSESGHMHVPAGKALQMFCPDQFQAFAETLIRATCESGNVFTVGDKNYAFSELVCKSWPSFVARKNGSDCEGGSLLQVGFQISPTRFVEQMKICFDEEEEVTRYVYHTLHPGSEFYQTSVERIKFHTGGFFGGKNVDKLYNQKMQMKIINEDLGGEAHKYFDSSNNVFLARGHLSAKADWMYGNQQRATFLFVNAAPQWQVFNAGNWARLEDSLRTWVSRNRMHVECYTGVYGVTTLPDREGRETPLYLARDANNNGLIPVPKLYFRVVIEPKTQKGIVFLGVNNPHLTLKQIEEDYIICNDISDKVNYIKWKRKNLKAGYSYACEVADFADAVQNLPRLSAAGGLLL